MGQRVVATFFRVSMIFDSYSNEDEESYMLRGKVFFTSF